MDLSGSKSIFSTVPVWLLPDSRVKEAAEPDRVLTSKTTGDPTRLAALALITLTPEAVPCVKLPWATPPPSLTLGWLEVDIKGTPGTRLSHEIYAENDVTGTWATGTKAINAIPFVCAAKPGLVSPLDLPLARRLELR